MITLPAAMISIYSHKMLRPTSTRVTGMTYKKINGIYYYWHPPWLGLHRIVSFTASYESSTVSVSVGPVIITKPTDSSGIIIAHYIASAKNNVNLYFTLPYI